MTKVKICGLSRECDIQCINEVKPEFAGFVFAKGSRRCIDAETGSRLRSILNDNISAVGVFVDEDPLRIAEIADRGIINVVQLHGHEDNTYIKNLRSLTALPIIQAFIINDKDDIMNAESSNADHILLDSGKGSGNTFDWSLIEQISRPFFLAGGLSPDNVSKAVSRFLPFAVDASSSLETGGFKDPFKIRQFVNAVRQCK